MLALVIIALVLRLAWIGLMIDRHPCFDEVEYIDHAHRLANGYGYIDDKGRPTAYWPVGYPAVLSVAYSMAGGGVLTGMLLQALLGTMTCLLISALGSELYGRRIGRLAGLLAAIYPNHVFYASLHLTEPLATLLFVAAALFLVKTERDGVTLPLMTGVTFGLAALTRPVNVLFPFLLPVWYFIRGRSPIRYARSLLLIVVGMLVAIAPWMARNYSVTGRMTVISTNGGQVFWVGNHPDAFGGYAYSHEIEQQLWDGQRYDSSRGYRLGFESIKANPGRALLRSLQKVTYLMALETDGTLWNVKGFADQPPFWLVLVCLLFANLFYVGVIALCMLGLLGESLRTSMSSFFVVLSVYLVLMTMVFIGDPRYHYSLIPFASILASKAVVKDVPAIFGALERKESWAWRKLVVWASWMALFCFSMLANLFLKDLEFRSLGTGWPVITG